MGGEYYQYSTYVERDVTGKVLIYDRWSGAKYCIYIDPSGGVEHIAIWLNELD